MKQFQAIIGLFLLAAVLSQSGCEQSASDTDFYKLDVPAEKVRTIEPFELEQYRTPEQPTVPSVLELPKEPLEKLDLALDQCRALALENNLDLKVQLMNPTIEQEKVNAERAKFESSFFTNIDYYKIDRPDAVSNTIQGSQGETSNMDLGVEVPLQTGGTITFNLSDDRNKTNQTSYRLSHRLPPD